MPVALYMDVHVPLAITEQLRRRGVNVLMASDDGADEMPDAELLERVRGLGRVIFTQDLRFKALAEQWIRERRPFAGLIFGAQLGGTIGDFVRDLEMIAQASDQAEWANVVEHIPFKSSAVS
jgi:hypothetical protein